VIEKKKIYIYIYLCSTVAGDQERECDREGEYANIRHYWSGDLDDDKDDGSDVVRSV